jgi:hypothetical protein
MKITKRQLTNFLKNTVINEAAARSWDQYLKATPKGKAVKDMWDSVQKNKENIVNKDSNVSPAKFDNSYQGWVKWYNACRKDAETMKALGKSAGSHISPEEMQDVYSAYLPPGKTGDEEVDNLIASIFSTGNEPATIVALRKARRQDANIGTKLFNAGAKGEDLKKADMQVIQNMLDKGNIDASQKAGQSHAGDFNPEKDAIKQKLQRESKLTRREIRNIVESIARRQ